MRPKTVTFICWFIIVTGGISIVISFVFKDDPLIREHMTKSSIPKNIQYVKMYLGLLIIISSGILMLKGQSWARFLYVGWQVVSLIIGVTTSPIKIGMIPSIVVFFVFVFLLFRPKANAYFKATEVTM